MNQEYIKLKEFWNNTLKSDSVEVIDSKWVQDENLNNAFKKYFKENSNVLDYGTGSGWGIIEVSYTIKLNKGIGLDTSINGIDYARKVLEASNISNIEYICGDENELLNYQDYFDGAISFNCIDVVPDEVVESIMKMVSKSLKKESYFLVGINPEYPLDFLESLGYTKNGKYLYKNNILRGNKHSKEEWIKILSKYFNVVDYFTFALTEKEKKYPRRMFVLKNKK